MTQYSELAVPDVGDFKDVPIIEMLVVAGDELTPNTTVVTLESDKASMEVPAEVTGVVIEVLVEVGDRVSEGSILLRYEPVDAGVTVATPSSLLHAASEETSSPAEDTNDLGRGTEQIPVSPAKLDIKNRVSVGPASPSVRRLARELGVDLSAVSSSGPKGRLQKDDIRSYVKQMMKSGEPQASGSSLDISEPIVDFTKFGPVEAVPITRIRKISGDQLARNWAMIPHVTSFDDADITDLEDFRRQLNQEQPVKLTLLPFLMKAVQHALQKFPHLNSSRQGDQLIVKKYFHIGFAVDTPDGLLVPVIRDVNTKGLFQIGAELAELAALARKGQLKREQMQGGTFTISNLGNFGGTRFTPIINAPEVAILAVGRSAMQPVWDGSQFLPQLILPLSLSWDHRVLNGVAASRFNVLICQVLADYRRILL